MPSSNDSAEQRKEQLLQLIERVVAAGPGGERRLSDLGQVAEYNVLKKGLVGNATKFLEKYPARFELFQKADLGPTGKEIDP